MFSLLCYTFDFVNKQIRSYNAKLFLKIKAKTNDESLVVALLLLPELVHGAVRFTLSLKRTREKRRGEHAHKSTRFDFSKVGFVFSEKSKREIARYSTTRDRTTPKAPATERPTNTIASVTALHDNVPCFSRNPKWQKSNSCPCTSRPDPNARCSLESPRDLCT